MTLADLDRPARFRTSAEVFDEIRAACEANPDLAQFETIGHSEGGRPIAGVTLGYGPRTVTLVAGAHADEPVGPETLRTLVLEGLARARVWEPRGAGWRTCSSGSRSASSPTSTPTARPATRRGSRRGDADRPAQTLGHFPAWAPPRAAGPRRRVRVPGDAARERRREPVPVPRTSPVALHASLARDGVFGGGRCSSSRKTGSTAPPSAASRTASSGRRPRPGSGSTTTTGVPRRGSATAAPGFWTTPEGSGDAGPLLRPGGTQRRPSRFFLSSMETAVLTGRTPPPPRVGRGGQAGGGRRHCASSPSSPLFVLGAEYDREHRPPPPCSKRSRSGRRRSSRRPPRATTSPPLLGGPRPPVPGPADGRRPSTSACWTWPSTSWAGRGAGDE